VATIYICSQGGAVAPGGWAAVRFTTTSAEPGDLPRGGHQSITRRKPEMAVADDLGQSKNSIDACCGKG